MSIYRRGEIYWAKISTPSGIVRVSLKTRNRAEAQRAHKALSAEVRAAPKRSGYSVADALALWLAQRDRPLKQLLHVQQMLGMIEADAPADQFNQGTLDAACPSSTPGTYNRHLNLIRAALNLAYRAGHIAAPPRLVRRKEPPPVDKWITPEQWTALRAQLPEHQQHMADFALATGLRWSNVARLQWRHINGRTASIPADQSKTRKALQIPLSDAAMAALERVRGVDLVYCFTYDGRPIQRPHTAFNKAKARAGLHDFEWRSFRHTWAAWHTMHGTPGQALQQLGGWTDAKMVSRYAHLAPSHLAIFADAPASFLAQSGHNQGKRKNNAKKIK